MACVSPLAPRWMFFWRAAYDFIIVAGRRADIGNNPPALDNLFDMSVHIYFFNNGGPWSDVGRPEAPGPYYVLVLPLSRLLASSQQQVFEGLCCVRCDREFGL